LAGAIAAALPAFCHAAGEAAAPDQKNGGLTLASEAVVAAIGAAVVAYCIHLFRDRARTLREHEAMQEAMMEAELRMFEKQLEPPAVASADGGLEEELERLVQGDDEVPLPATVATPSPAVSGGTGAPDSAACEAVVSRMRAAGMVEDMDGYMELHGNPKAALTVRMRGGKRARVVPFYETEVFAERNLRRFDYLVFIGRSGNAVIVRTLESLIADTVGGNLR
jgi:hypothetical protein